MAFYRTYRPKVIAEIDNPKIQKDLLSFLTKEKSELPHAFLFSGPRGSGKTTAARIIAKLFNCDKPGKDGAPCGKCEQCQAVASGKHLDVLEIDAASNRGIDEIRTLRDTIHLAPSIASYKVYIIDEVHMLTTEAFNALLKTLEEPPAHAVFILATTDPQKVPVTVKSRCLSILFSKAQLSQLVQALKRIAKAEKIEIDDTALTKIAEYADGSFRDAVKLLEQVSFHQGQITARIVESALSLSEEKLLENFFALLKKRDTKALITLIATLMNEGRDLKAFLLDCLGRLERLLLAKVKDEEDIDWTLDELRMLIQSLTRAYNDMKYSPMPQLPLELAILEYVESFETNGSILEQNKKASDSKDKASAQIESVTPQKTLNTGNGLLTLEKLTEFWKDFIEELKPYNHSVAGVLRSSRPKQVGNGIVIIEAFYKFHQEKLSEGKTRDVLAAVLKKLFGENVKVEIVLGRK